MTIFPENHPADTSAGRVSPCARCPRLAAELADTRAAVARVTAASLDAMLWAGRNLDDPRLDRTAAAEAVATGLLDRIGGIIADLVAPNTDQVGDDPVMRINTAPGRMWVDGHPHLRAVATEPGWQVSWLLGHFLTENEAMTAMVLAAAITDGCTPGHPMWCHAAAWADELGLGCDYAVRLITQTNEMAAAAIDDATADDGGDGL